MRTGKWLAYSVILFLFLRALILVQGRPSKSDESDDNQRHLSRTKRFSINEYLMLALSLFNGFVFLYNNVETFFPIVKTRSQSSVNSNNQNNVQTSAQQNLSPDITISKSSLGILARNDDSSIEGSQDFEREKLVNQIAEMLIRYCRKAITRLLLSIGTSLAFGINSTSKILGSYLEQVLDLVYSLKHYLIKHLTLIILGEKSSPVRFLRISDGRWYKT